MEGTCSVNATGWTRMLVLCLLHTCYASSNKTQSPWAPYIPHLKMRGVDTTVSKDTASSKAHAYLTRDRRELSIRCGGLVSIHTPERPVHEERKKVRDGKKEHLTWEDCSPFGMSCQLQKFFQEVSMAHKVKGRGNQSWKGFNTSAQIFPRGGTR